MSVSSLVCDVKYTQRSSPVAIADEGHTVETDVPYSVSLKERPSEDYEITIPGYTEMTSAPTSAGYFYVDHLLSRVYFNFNDARNDVAVSYHGTGSPIVRDDVNRFSVLLDALKLSVYAFRVEALSGSMIRMCGGKFISGTAVFTKKELFMDFGLNGNFEIMLSDGCFKKVLVGINVSTTEVSKVEGDEAPKYGAARAPSFSSDFKPAAIVTVGSDFDILQKDIIPVRNFLI